MTSDVMAKWEHENRIGPKIEPCGTPISMFFLKGKSKTN